MHNVYCVFCEISDQMNKSELVAVCPTRNVAATLCSIERQRRTYIQETRFVEDPREFSSLMTLPSMQRPVLDMERLHATNERLHKEGLL
jgi:hypothetical protein